MTRPIDTKRCKSCVWHSYCYELGWPLTRPVCHGYRSESAAEPPANLYPGIRVRPATALDQLHLIGAAHMAGQSTCSRVHFGAVIASRDGSQGRAWGCNHHWAGPDVHCSPCVRRTVRARTRIELCNAVHAEQDALLGYRDNAPAGAMYLWAASPWGEPHLDAWSYSCTLCARLLAQAQLPALIQPAGWNTVSVIPGDLLVPIAMRYVTEDGHTCSASA